MNEYEFCIHHILTHFKSFEMYSLSTQRLRVQFVSKTLLRMINQWKQKISQNKKTTQKSVDASTKENIQAQGL